tara:strand:- start:924 stop:1187 length:264 start_codon:yes stop_codon:yes gene_type:complete
MVAIRVKCFVQFVYEGKTSGNIQLGDIMVENAIQILDQGTKTVTHWRGQLRSSWGGPFGFWRFHVTGPVSWQERHPDSRVLDSGVCP